SQRSHSVSVKVLCTIKRTAALRSRPRAAERGSVSAVRGQRVDARAQPVGRARVAHLSEVGEQARQRLEITLQGPAPFGAQVVSTLRLAPFDALGAHDVARSLELARLDREIAVGGLQQVA